MVGDGGSQMKTTKIAEEIVKVMERNLRLSAQVNPQYIRLAQNNRKLSDVITISKRRRYVGATA